MEPSERRPPGSGRRDAATLTFLSAGRRAEAEPEATALSPRRGGICGLPLHPAAPLTPPHVPSPRSSEAGPVPLTLRSIQEPLLSTSSCGRAAPSTAGHGDRAQSARNSPANSIVRGGKRGAMREESEKESRASGSAALGYPLLICSPGPSPDSPPSARALTHCPALLFFFFLIPPLRGLVLGIPLFCKEQDWSAGMLGREGVPRQHWGGGAAFSSPRPQPHSRALGPLPPRTVQPPNPRQWSCQNPMPCVLQWGGGTQLES